MISGLRKQVARLGLGAATIILSATLTAAPPASPRLPTKQQLKACPALKDIDFRRIYAETRPAEGWRERMDAQHLATRGPFGAFEAPADAELVLRIWAAGSHTQETRTDTSSVVWKGKDGLWRVDRVDHATTRPPPPPPPPPAGWDGKSAYFQRSADEEARLVREHIRGLLDPQRAEAIERTLRDPCFALQPDAMPLQIPAKKGRPAPPPCWGIIGGTLEMRWADGRRRDVTELCGGFYSRGILDAVMYARPQTEDARTKALCDPLRATAAAGALMPPQRRDLAFCEAGIAGAVEKAMLDEGARDRLAADALALAPNLLMKRYPFLSEWAAGALTARLAARARAEVVPPPERDRTPAAR